MTPTQPLVLEPLAEGSLKPVCAAAGPFVTAYLGAYRPGAQELPMATRLKAVVRDAAAELGRRRYREGVDPLLGPLEQLTADPVMSLGGGDVVIFSAPGFSRRMRLAAPGGERLIVARHPYITPALSGLLAEREFFILVICRKEPRLGRWRDGECEEIPLPASVPKNLDEALLFDQPDHSMWGRSTAGRLAGQNRRIQFSTSSDREKADKYMHNYLRIVDRELTPALRGSVLVAVGTDDELAAYRRAAEYPRLIDARQTGGERLNWTETGALAQRAVLAAQQQEAEKVLAEAREAPRRDHVLTRVRQVLKAAIDGRVHKLLVAAGSEVQGRFGRLYPKDAASLQGEQDLLNAAAVETIRAGGDVHMLEAERLGELGPVAAMLRY